MGNHQHRLTRLSLALAFAVGSLPALAQDAPEDTAAAMEYLSTLQGEERLDVLEREAAREGSLMIYGAIGIDRAQILIDVFHESYPDIEVEFVRQAEAELVDKVLIESRTGQVNADLVISNTPWLDLLKGTLAAYVPTTADNFDDRFLQGSVEEGWTALVYEITGTTIAWRTDRVDAAEAPRTLEDVTDPQWRGRLGTTTHLERLMDAMITTYGEEKATALIEALAETDSQLYRSTAALSEALAIGEIDVAWNFSAHRPAGLKESGAPVDYVYQDPLFGLGITASILDGAQHPYAAALFLEVLSRAETLETLDALEGGRFFGNTKGTYTNALADYPDLLVYPPIPEEEFGELNRTAERLFIRR